MPRRRIATPADHGGSPEPESGAHERRLRALAAFIAAYEAEHGELTEDEMCAAAHRARARALTT